MASDLRGFALPVGGKLALNITVMASKSAVILGLFACSHTRRSMASSQMNLSSSTVKCL